MDAALAVIIQDAQDEHDVPDADDQNQRQTINDSRAVSVSVDTGGRQDITRVLKASLEGHLGEGRADAP